MHIVKPFNLNLDSLLAVQKTKGKGKRVEATQDVGNAAPAAPNAEVQPQPSGDALDVRQHLQRFKKLSQLCLQHL